MSAHEDIFLNARQIADAVERAAFLDRLCAGDTVRRAAWQAGRAAQVLRVAGAGADHPFLAHVPEGRYLKAVFCRVG